MSTTEKLLQNSEKQREGLASPDKARWLCAAYEGA
jgi:hypothetical protein